MKREVKIGIYAVVIIACAWAGIRFLSGVDVFGRNATYYAYYDEVNGLQNAAPVMIKGVKVGQVTDVAVDPVEPAIVKVTLSMARQYKLPTDTEARLVSTSIMGGEGIEIIIGQNEALLESGATIPSSYEAGLLASLEGVKEKVVNLVDNLNTTLLSLNSLVEGNSANLTQTIAHLNSISKGLDDAIGGDTGNLAGIVESINSFAVTLKENAGKIEGIVTDVDALTSDLVAGNTAASLAGAVEQLNATLARINGGEGSVGKLIGDEQLYSNLATASENLSALLADLKENPKRYVHFSLFGQNEEKMKAKAEKRAAKAAQKAAAQ